MFQLSMSRERERERLKEWGREEDAAIDLSVICCTASAPIRCFCGPLPPHSYFCIVIPFVTSICNAIIICLVMQKLIKFSKFGNGKMIIRKGFKFNFDNPNHVAT